MDFSSKKLTLEQTKRLHRELWFWIENNPTKYRVSWPGWHWYKNDFDLFIGHSTCWLCLYAKECCFCPVMWDRDKELDCAKGNSPYLKYRNIVLCWDELFGKTSSSNNFSEEELFYIIKYAREIRNIKWKDETGR